MQLKIYAPLFKAIFCIHRFCCFIKIVRVLKMIHSVVGIDVGSGFTKFAYRERGDIHKKSFRSIALPHFESEMATTLRRTPISPAIKIITVNNRKFEVDTDESAPVMKVLGERNEADDFPTRPEYRALVYGALAALNASRVSRLVLGLPLHTFAKHAGEVQKAYRGTLACGATSVIVESVTVVPQPVGSLLTLVAEGDPTLAATNACLVDVGHYTTDWLVSHGKRIDYSRCGGRAGGASHVFRAVAEALSTDLNESFEGLDQIDLALRNGTPLLAYGKPIEVRSYLERAKEVAMDTARAVRAKVGTAEDLTLVLTGGGSWLYRQAFETVFAKNRLVQLERGRFANAAGFVLFGEQQTSQTTR
ncbi:PRTRC system protein D [Ralstonia sp. GX3-BWBA]|uniref:PRTRC system protein D n=1 Tax=Ralstonia sp. GX3-BWBA TaxID=2219865 RepID=UPI0013A6A3E3|nr:PRTRC system protein D [Ralstonia sp. GX3-BWBA]